MAKRGQVARVKLLVADWRQKMREVVTVLCAWPNGVPAVRGWVFADDGRERLHRAAIAARDATNEIVPTLRSVSIEAGAAARELASNLGAGHCAQFDRVVPLARRVESLVAEIVAAPPRERKGARKGTLDALAAGLAEAWSDPSSASFRPDGWLVRDLAAELKCTVAALTGKQRDGSMRCPDLHAVRARLGRGAKRRRRPKQHTRRRVVLPRVPQTP